jgi:hypothetical protein
VSTDVERKVRGNIPGLVIVHESTNGLNDCNGRQTDTSEYQTQKPKVFCGECRGASR